MLWGADAMSTTVIRNAAWVIAWDEAAGHHTYRRGVDLAFEDDRIAFIGRDFPGTADRVIDGSVSVVIPGLIVIHSHPEHEPLYRGIREEHGLPSMHMTFFFQAEDGIRAPLVTGVQTCALPISAGELDIVLVTAGDGVDQRADALGRRSEERRVGKECKSRCCRNHEKKKLPSMHMTGIYESAQAPSAPDDEAHVARAGFSCC